MRFSPDNVLPADVLSVVPGVFSRASISGGPDYWLDIHWISRESEARVIEHDKEMLCWERYLFVDSATSMALNTNPAASLSSVADDGQYGNTYTSIG